MPTPIRVRGKNTRDQSRKVGRNALENVSSTKARGRPLKLVPSSVSNSAVTLRCSTPFTTPSTKRRKVKTGLACHGGSKTHISPLESLPVELLQSIFLFSLNLQLPLTSSSLNVALSSEHVYTELVSLVLSGVKTLEGLGFLYPEISTVSLRTTLMSLRWFTLDLVKKSQARFVQQIVDRERRDNSRPIVKIETRDYWLRGPFEDDGILSMSEVIQYEHNRSKSIRTYQGCTIQCVDILEQEPFPNGQILSILEMRSTSRMYRLPHCIVGYVSPAIKPSLIPEKLLHGPWTKEKVELLELLCQAGAAVDWVNTSAGEVAERGLEEAIMEGNLRALRLLMHGSSGANYYGINVRIDTRHLRMAVMEAGCRQEIVEALAYDRDNGIDFSDEKVMAWAFKAQADGNEKGSWVLSLLDCCSSLRRREPESEADSEGVVSESPLH
ncbi:MAG: hypothetical protein M1830_009471 [Pleopsidium flavum]|nr:MAG: hypothetical protein M1830_009471 [Pleopsidium flavum]